MLKKRMLQLIRRNLRVKKTMVKPSLKRKMPSSSSITRFSVISASQNTMHLRSCRHTFGTYMAFQVTSSAAIRSCIEDVACWSTFPSISIRKHFAASCATRTMRVKQVLSCTTCISIFLRIRSLSNVPSVHGPS
uniref:(northern house mosquito) hypothetical protein n=1 Tax=Culex pipiens TaxID=7175 RepID=A0A8D8JRI8_CULPI